MLIGILKVVLWGENVSILESYVYVLIKEESHPRLVILNPAILDAELDICFI